MKEPRKILHVPGKADAEVDSELRFHLDERIRANIAAGMSPDEARRAALERFGDVDGVRDECARLLVEERKTKRRRDWIDDFRQDLRFAIRSAAGAPLFTLLAALTLALGIGANAAMFGVVKSVLLNSLPYADADRLTRIYTPIKSLGERIPSGTAEAFHKRAGASIPEGLREALMPLVERLFTERTTDEWLERLQGAGVPATPIQSVDRVLADSQVRHRRMVVDVEHPRHGRLPTLGTPIKVDGRMGLDVTAAPRLGQHTDEILTGRLKYSGECVAALRQQGVIA